jgi:wobble nucleotide-excising tRNase
MPNDIHNTRVETLESNDNEAFRDFVKYGEGAESVNSENPPDENTAQRAKEQKGKAATEQAQAKQQAGTRKNERVQEQRQIRPEGAPGASDRQRSMRDRDMSHRGSRNVGDRERSRGGRGRN